MVLLVVFSWDKSVFIRFESSRLKERLAGLTTFCLTNCVVAVVFLNNTTPSYLMHLYVDRKLTEFQQFRFHFKILLLCCRGPVPGGLAPRHVLLASSRPNPKPKLPKSHQMPAAQ